MLFDNPRVDAPVEIIAIRHLNELFLFVPGPSALARFQKMPSADPSGERSKDMKQQKFAKHLILLNPLPLITRFLLFLKWCHKQMLHTMNCCVVFQSSGTKRWGVMPVMLFVGIVEFK